MLEQNANSQNDHIPAEHIPPQRGDEKRILIYLSGTFVLLAFIAYMITKSTQVFELLDNPFLIIIGYYFGSQSK